MVKRTASLQVIQRDARSSWSSTPLWPTRGVTNTAQDNSVLDNAFVLIDDLIAIDPATLNRYHIESGVSIASGFSKLSNKPYSPDELKIRVKQAQQRRTLGCFTERKFGSAEVIDTLRKYGFNPGEYTCVIVSWGWEPDVELECGTRKIELWDFRNIVKEIAYASTDKRTYFTDDTIRTLQLFVYAVAQQGKAASAK